METGLCEMVGAARGFYLKHSPFVTQAILSGVSHGILSLRNRQRCDRDSELAFELLRASGDQGFLHAKFTAAILRGADADATAAALGGEQMDIKRSTGLLQKPRTPKPRVSISRGRNQ